MTNLVPEYLDLDFNTFKESIKTQLANTTTFADYNYEGSNIAVLIELMAYLSDVHTFLLNKIAKNTYIDTADIYENVHKLARSIGYEAKGYRSARATVTVTLSTAASATIEEGETITVEPWKEIDSDQSYDGDVITFSSILQTTTTAPAPSAYPFEFDVEMRQGQVSTLSYTGNDIIDGQIILPIKDYGYDDDLDDTYPTVRVVMNGITEWRRVGDFYDEISSLAYSDNVFMLNYDKYEQYVLEFSTLRNVPLTSDTIVITLLESIGLNGSVGANTIIVPNEDFVNYNTGAISYTLDDDLYTVTNTSASVGAADPEDIDTIKQNAKSQLHSQYRNVTKQDYISTLETRSDITVANVWGEQEVAPSGDTTQYNKVYISLIPAEWGESTISTTTPTSGDYEDLTYPSTYSASWEDELEAHLETYKMLCTYEEFSIPILIYFSFNIGLRVRTVYSYANVMTDTRAKLIYYFTAAKRKFGEIIKFTDIENYLLDDTETSPTNSFTNVKGIQNLIIRNVDINVTAYEPNSAGNYPQYTVSSGTAWDENALRYLDLRYDQFPALDINGTTFTQES